MRGIWRARTIRDDVVSRVRLLRAKGRVAAFPSIRRRAPHKLPLELIVSLTSYPARFSTLGLTLRGLLDQTVAPDRTILWVAEGDYDEIPDNVRELERFGLDIRPCAD